MTMIIARILSTDPTHRSATGSAEGTQNAPASARTALRRVNGYLKNMIEAIANSKLRRMERELELRGIHFDRSSNNWVVRNSEPRSRGIEIGPTAPANSNSAFRVERHMPRLSSIASVLISHLRSAASALVTFLGPSWDGPVRKYRPEDHYMRGPGPKWREKHVLDRASSAGGR